MNIEIFLSQELAKSLITLPKGKSIEDAVRLFIYGARQAGWNHKTASSYTSKFTEKQAGCKNHYIWFLNHRGLKLCTKCREVLPLLQFNNNISNKDGAQSYCKKCTSLYMKRYPTRGSTQRAKQLKAIPKWADIQAIEDFYNNCPKGYHVDHIIPLAGISVCGLHVLNNLQYLPARDNLIKSNKYHNAELTQW